MAEDTGGGADEMPLGGLPGRWGAAVPADGLWRHHDGGAAHQSRGA